MQTTIQELERRLYGKDKVKDVTIAEFFADSTFMQKKQNDQFLKNLQTWAKQIVENFTK